jgi:hypothetical protein
MHRIEQFRIAQVFRILCDDWHVTGLATESNHLYQQLILFITQSCDLNESDNHILKIKEDSHDAHRLDH